MKKDDVSLSVQSGRLVISGSRRSTLAEGSPERRRTRYVVQEVKYGRFYREVELPPDLQVPE
jgi:HSP20 family molecular chaperone IbpA